MTKGWADENVPRRLQEIVKVTRIEGNLIKISAPGGIRQIRRLNNMHLRPALREALTASDEIVCVANVNNRGMFTLIGVAQPGQ